jgi:uncharacterized protein YvpB
MSKRRHSHPRTPAVASATKLSNIGKTVIQVHDKSAAPMVVAVSRGGRIRYAVRLRRRSRAMWEHLWGRPGGRLKTAALWVACIGAVTAMGGGAVTAHRPVQLQPIAGHLHDQPVRIVFARTVHSGVTVRWQEKVEGIWRHEHSLGGVKAAVFTPKTRLAPGAVLHAEVTNLRPAADLLSKTPARQVVTVRVQSAQSLRGIVPAIGAQNVLPDTTLTVTLAGRNHRLRQLQLYTDIPLKTSNPSSTDDVSFRWQLAAPLEQGRQYSAEVRDLNQPPERQRLTAFSFQTVAEPQLSSAATGFITPGSVVNVDFDQDMAQSASTIEFTAPGSGAWKGPRQYAFTFGAVTPGTAYNYKVAKGSKSAAGGTVMADHPFSVRTPGPVRVLGARPTGTRLPLDAPVSLTFDQPVNRASAEAAFQLTPRVDGSFAWSGNTMTFRPSGYGYQTTYAYGVAAGIQPVFGQPGEAYMARFTTAYEIKKLSVPYYRQAYALSCEAASVRMAMAYYGTVAGSDMEILERIGYHPQPRDTATNTWQDPNIEFVGDVNGRLNVTGWGVYAAPVARAARSYGRSAEVVYGPSVQTVASAIHAGNPVVVWGVVGWAAVDDSWNTATSGVVHAAKNQHVRVAVGVEGSAGDPAAFYLHDPLRSGNIYVSAAQLQASMNGGGRQVVIVR